MSAWFDGADFNAMSLMLTLVSLWLAVFFGQRALRPPERELRLHSTVSETAGGRYDVVLILRVTGQHDISSAQFDQGLPCVFALFADNVADCVNSTGAMRIDGDNVVVPPRLLARTRIHKMTFTCSNVPILGVDDSSLIDTVVRVRTRLRERRLETFAARAHGAGIQAWDWLGIRISALLTLNGAAIGWGIRVTAALATAAALFSLILNLWSIASSY